MKFIILSQQRSGSHMLMNLLNSHPDIHCNSDSQTIAIETNGKQWAYDVGFDPDSKVKGFLLKIKTNLYKEITPDENIKIIYLKRENFLHILLSKQIAKIFGCYENNEAEITLANARASREDASPITLDVKEAEKFFNFWDKTHSDVRKCLDTAGLEYIEVKYSNLCSNTKSVMNEIYNFLKVEGAEPSFVLGRGSEKLDSRKPYDAISNYNKLKRHFERDGRVNGTRWFRFFENKHDIWE